MSSDDSARMLIGKLAVSGRKIVFAESCTAGLIAATLGRIPGASSVLAGSAVVYQLETKHAWLGVDREALIDTGAVSKTVSEQMARGVLSHTPHSRIAASITGHLGPEAPPELDGVAWSSVAVNTDNGVAVVSRRLDLSPSAAEATASSMDAISVRHARQRSAVEQVLLFCITVADGGDGPFD